MALRGHAAQAGQHPFMSLTLKPGLYRVLKVLLLLFFRSYLRLHVTGQEWIPHGACVVIANHRSNMDPPLIGVAMPRPIYYMAKEELFRFALFGRFLTWIGVFPVRRGRYDRRAINQALCVLRAGYALSVFPEGTRQRHGRGTLGPERDGAALLAVWSGVPVLPAAIVGNYGWRQPVEVRFGPPIRLEGPVRSKDLAEKSRRLMLEIQGLLDAGPPGRRSGCATGS